MNRPNQPDRGCNDHQGFLRNLSFQGGGGPKNLDNVLSSESAQKQGADNGKEAKFLQSGIQGQGGSRGPKE